MNNDFKMKACLFLLMLFLVCSMLSIGTAEELTKMTYEELINLQESLNLQIWNAGNWRKIIIPFGKYTVGVDIPSGEYLLVPWGKKAFFDIKHGEDSRTIMLEGEEKEEIELFDDDIVVVDQIGSFLALYPKKYRPTFRSNHVEQEDTQYLFDLNDAIIQEIKSRDFWEEVFVPRGVYEIGVEIPEGKWTIKTDNDKQIGINYGNIYSIHDSFLPRSDDGTDVSAYLVSETDPQFDQYEDVSSVSIDAKAGYYISVEWYAEEAGAVFTPYVGKQLFFFFND